MEIIVSALAVASSGMSDRSSEFDVDFVDMPSVKGGRVCNFQNYDRHVFTCHPVDIDLRELSFAVFELLQTPVVGSFPFPVLMITSSLCTRRFNSCNPTNHL